MGERRLIELTVNGEPREAEPEVRTSLADLLRHELRLHGTHVGCEQGACGACTVLVDGEPVRSCLMLAVQAHGRDVETVESLAPDGGLNAVQHSFQRHHGLQCGFCTPGILMSLEEARRAGAPLDEVLEDVLGGHLCRCTGYVNIRAAITAAWSEEASP